MDEGAAGYPLRFAGLDFVARPSGALWWPARRVLAVADLHLGRSQRYARRGGALLPPYEVADTLDRLAAEIDALDPARVISLGDGFDDGPAMREIGNEARDRLDRLAQGRDWIWIAGNHDPEPAAPLSAHSLPGRSMAEIPGTPTFRHIAASGPDISGHLHPVVRLAGRNWRCFALGAGHLILPAFGTYTGGLAVTARPFRALMPQGLAICCAGRMFAVPI